MPYCHVPWTNIDISPKGDISPCCKFTNYSYSVPNSNINRNTIEEYTNSPILNLVKEDFLNDRWPKGCSRCQLEEQYGIDSKRIIEQNRWKDHLENHQKNGFISASVAFGNTCNLTCIICDPGSSSKWHHEYKKLYGVDIRPNHFYKDGFVENLIKHTPNLKHMDIPGGEPMLSGVDQQQQLLEYFVKENKAKDISLHYTTNCTIFPNEKWLSLWEHFKEVEFQLSIDGIEKRFEYLRYPANWDLVQNNAIKYKNLKDCSKNIKLSVATTVSAYNIAYLDELVSWCIDTGLGKPWLGRLHNPIHLRPTVWRVDGKKFIIQQLRYSENKSVLKPFIHFIETEDDSKHFSDFRYRLLRHDNYRNIKYSDFFPEMFEFLLDKK